MLAFDLLHGHAGALRSEVLGSGYGHRDVLRAPSKHSTGPRASRATAHAMAHAMALVRLRDSGGPLEARRYTQPTSDIARRRGPAIRKARRDSNSHSARRQVRQRLARPLSTLDDLSRSGSSVSLP